MRPAQLTTGKHDLQSRLTTDRLTKFDLRGVRTAAEDEPRPGSCQPLDKSKLPSWNNLDPEVLKHLDHYDPGVKYSAPYTWGSNGITYNVDKIRQRMPDAPIGSLAMLFDPQVVSKFADCGVTIIDSPTDVIPLALAYLKRDPNSAAPEARAQRMASPRFPNPA